MVTFKTKFNGMNITNGISDVSPGIRIQAGAGANDTFTMDVVPQRTLSIMLPLVSHVTSQTNTRNTLTTMVSALVKMSEQKAMIGASINRLTATINNLTASLINTEVALGRTVNTDFALESQKLAKEQILNQSSNAILVQTNSSKSTLLQYIS